MSQLQIRLFGPYLSSFSAHSYGYALSNEPKSDLKLPNFRFGPETRQTPRIAIACGKVMVRYIPLEKYVALVEQMYIEESASVMLQNFSDQEDGRMAKGQTLGRINQKYSAITVIQGGGR